MVAAQRPLTYEDLLRLPDDGKRHEVIGGKLIVTPAPTADHQRVLLQLILLLENFVRTHPVGELFVAPFDVRLGPHDIVEPDLVFIAADRGRIPGAQNTFDGPPDLVVEIISPSSRQADIGKKMALYARAGVPEYWIADPEYQSIVVNVLEGRAYVAVEPDADGVIASRVLPGMLVDPAEVFAGLD